MNSDKPKILFVMSNPCIGGTETFTLSICSYLEREGCDVGILNVWKDSVMKKAALERRLSYRELSGDSKKISIKVVVEILRVVKENDYKIVFGFGLRITMILRLIRFFWGSRVLVTGLRGIDKWRKWYHVYMDRLTKGLTDYYIANSDAVAEQFMSREKYSKDKMVVIKNGIDLDEFGLDIKENMPPGSFSLPKGKIIISTVARFRHEKGHCFYIDVIKRYLSKFDNVVFVWAGEGFLKEQLQQELQKAGALSKVIMLGNVDNVTELLANSDVFVLPSREEGMSRSLMEAMSMSLPCVATNVGGAGELIENGKSGFIEEFEDVDAFGQSIVDLIEDEHLRKDIGAEARKTIEEKFDMLMIANQYACFFYDIISENKDDTFHSTLENMVV